MSESSAGSYAALAGIEIVNDSRTFAYLKNGLGPGSIAVYGECSCPNIVELLGCETPTNFDTIDGVNLTGDSGAYVSTPDSAALSVAGDLQITAKFAPVSIAPVSNQNIVAKWTATGNQRSYRLYLNTSGGLSLHWTTDGSTIITKSSTVPLPFVDGETFYVYATLDVDNGAAGNDVEFWYSVTGITYTKLGTTVTTAGITSIFDSTAPVELGSQDAGTNNIFTGKIYSVVIRDGIAPVGFEVGNPNFTPQDASTLPGNTTIIDDYGNTWTRHGAATFLPGTVVIPILKEYSSPSEDNAPWYSPSAPESGDFLGFIVEEFEGMSSPFKRGVQEGVGNGGVLGRSKLAPRTLQWRGYLFGATCCSVQYGLRWLTKTLSRFDTSCRDCAGDDLEILICCPDATTSDSPFRTLKGVGLVDGPKILSERKTCQGACSPGTDTNCGGSCIIEIEFSLVASQPYLYSPPIPVYDCLSLTEGSVSPYTESTVDCGDEDCTQLVIADLCPQPVLPPTAIYSNSCVPETLVTPRANYYSVSRSYWNDLEDVVPVISITTGALSVGYLRLGFYSSGSDSPCSDLSLYPPDCDVICDELGILGIPSLSTFYIDGRNRKMAVVCPDGTAYPGERLTSGPWSWPSFDCYGFCMEILYDADGDKLLPFELACVSISLVPRTF